MERRADVMEHRADGVDHARRRDRGIEVAGPELLGDDARDGDHGADDKRRERARGRAAPPVEAEGDDHARAGPDRAGDGEEHQDEVDLREVVAEKEGEECNACDGQAQSVDLILRLEGSPAQRHDEVLHDDAAPRVHVRRVGRKHEENHHGDEESGDADGEDFADRHGDAHLGVDRAERLRRLAFRRRVDERRGGGGEKGIRGLRLIGLRRGEGLAEDLARRDGLVLCLQRDALGGQRLAACHVFERLAGELLAHVAGRVCEVGVVEERERHDAQQEEHHAAEAAAPRAQQRAHLRLMRRLRGAVVPLRAAPGHAPEEHSHYAGEDIEEVEVA